MSFRYFSITVLFIIGYGFLYAQDSSSKLIRVDTIYETEKEIKVRKIFEDSSGKIQEQTRIFAGKKYQTDFGKCARVDTIFNYKGKKGNLANCKVFLDQQGRLICRKYYVFGPIELSIPNDNSPANEFNPNGKVNRYYFTQDSMAIYNVNGTLAAEGSYKLVEGKTYRNWKMFYYHYNEKSGELERIETGHKTYYGQKGELEFLPTSIRFEACTGEHDTLFYLVSHSRDSIKINMWVENAELGLPWRELTLQPKDTLKVPLYCKLKSRLQEGQVLVSMPIYPNIDPFVLPVSLEGYDFHPKDFQKWGYERKAKPHTINRYQPVSIKGGSNNALMRLYEYDPDLSKKIREQEIYPLAEIPSGQNLNWYDWSSLESGEYVLRAIDLSTNKSVYRRITVVEEF